MANNDIVLQDDVIESLAAYADGHPTVGAVTPRFYDRSGTPQEFYRRLPNFLFVLAHYHRLGRVSDRIVFRRKFQNAYFLRDRDFTTVEAVDQPGATFSLLRRQAVDAAGILFDESFPLLFNDVDLFFRLKEVGFESHVLCDTRVVHLGGVSSGLLEESVYQRFQYVGMFEYFRKHHPFQYLLLFFAWPLRWIRFALRTTNEQNLNPTDASSSCARRDQQPS
jgi:hypothetical protein